MKHLWLPAFMLLASTLALGQQKRFSNTSELAAYIHNQYGDPMQKLTVAYNWVTTNIRYDTKGTYAMNNHPDSRNLIDKAFENRAGVCENFAAIFSDLCEKMGFTSTVIYGYTHQSSGANNSGHSWVGIYLNDDWYLFDPTWDVGKSAGYTYFMKTGSELSASHTPFDFLWQMQNHPATGGRKTTDFFNYKDSIAAYLALDSITKLESAIRRVSQIEKKNELTRTHLEVLKGRLEIALQEDQMVWYEQAIAKLNEATRMLNQLIDLRNSGRLGDEFGSVNKTIGEIKTQLNHSELLLKRVDESKAILVYGTGPARDQIQRLRGILQEQARYFALSSAKEQQP